MKHKIFTILFIASAVGGFIALVLGLNLKNALTSTIFFDVITAATALIGVFGLVYQSIRSRDLNEAQFIFSLNQEFIKNEKYQHLLSDIDANVSLNKKSLEIVAQYLDFFESLYILLKKKIINIEVIDALFCFRFFAVVNNVQVQNDVLSRHKSYYANICKLHYIWKKYHAKNHVVDIPFIETDLSLIPWYGDAVGKIVAYNKYKISKNDVIIRFAIESDIEAILRLYNEFLETLDHETENSKALLAKINNETDGSILVLCYQGKIIATVQYVMYNSLAYDCSSQIYVDFLVVDAKYRWMGLEVFLIEFITNVAKRNKVKIITFVSNNDGKIAHDLCKKLKYINNIIGARLYVK